MIVHQVEYQAKHCEHHGFQHDENHTVPIEPKKKREENPLKNRQIIHYSCYILHHQSVNIITYLSVIGSSLIIIEYH